MRERKTAGASEVLLPMMPMIDIVFLLLVFFLISLKPVDALAHLQADRPQGGPGRAVPLLRLEVQPDAFALNGRTLGDRQLERALMEMGRLDPNQGVSVVVSARSRHARMIEALDLCAAAGLTNLNVLTVP